MNKSPIIFSLVCLSLLTACGSSTTSSWITPEPGLRDEAVAALLPQGVYTVSGEWLKDEKPITTIEGHVSFGGGVDGSQCAAEYALTNVYPSDALGLKALDWVHVVTAPGGPTWQRGYFDPTGPGEWTDSSDLSAAEIPFVFIPAIIGADWNPGVLEGAGTGVLCSIPVMPRFMSQDGDRLVFDPDRTALALRAGRARWVEKSIDAAGITGRERDEVITKLVADTTPDYASMLIGVYITVTNNADGSIEMVQRGSEGTSVVRILFKPTEEREMTTVTAQSYFDRIRAEVKASGKPGIEYIRKEYGL